MFLFVEKYTLITGEGNSDQLQYSCLENSIDRGAWWATVHGVTKSWARLSDYRFTSQTLSTLQDDFPGGTIGKEFSCQCRRHRDMGLIPRSGRFSGKGNGNTLQYSCLGNALDREAWQTTVHGVAKSQM